jgi:hypothetical protein
MRRGVDLVVVARRTGGGVSQRELTEALEAGVRELGLLV